jgi:hypothetical protein
LDLTEAIGPYPYDAPPGKKWVPNGWKLIDDEPVQTSFEEVILNTLHPKPPQAKRKRFKVHSKSIVISTKEFEEELKTKEDEDKAKAQRKMEREALKQQSAAKKVLAEKRKIASSSEESSDDEDEGSQLIIASPTLAPALATAPALAPALKLHEFPTDIGQLEGYLRDVWNAVSPSTTESNLVNQYMAVVYTGKIKQLALYVGKFCQRFLSEERTEPSARTVSIELECLEQKMSTEDAVLSEHRLKKDKFNFDVHNIIAVDLQMEYIGANKWNMATYRELNTYFEIIKKQRDSNLLMSIHADFLENAHV